MLGLRKNTHSDIEKTYDLRYRAPLGEWVIISNDMKTVQDLEETVTALTGLIPNADYEFQVRMVGSLGRGGWSDSTVITTNPRGAFVY